MMRRIEGLDAAPRAARGCVAAVGMFDGVHLGHRAIAARAVGLAKETGAPSATLTFHPHPLAVLAPERAPRALSTREARAALLAALGVGFLIEEPFTAALAETAADDFLARVVRALSPHALVVGANFSFGAGGRGTPAFLKERGAALGVGVEVVPLLALDGADVSSTRVRACLEKGDVRLAGRLLGRPFAVEGTVVRGDARGRTLGFPTANLALSDALAAPVNGAYAARVVRADGTAYAAIVNIGDNPTFGGVSRRLEAHLLDFSGDLYGESLRVEMIERLRGETRFPSAEALCAQLRKDEAAARALLAQ